MQFNMYIDINSFFHSPTSMQSISNALLANYNKYLHVNAVIIPFDSSMIIYKNSSHCSPTFDSVTY